MRKTYRWRALEDQGLEQLLLTVRPDTVLAESTVTGEDTGTPYVLTYRVRCDGAWRVRKLEVACQGGPRLHLEADGDGNWWHAGDGGRGERIAALDGCIDADISATPFTNTLPLRRLGSALTARTEIAVVYVRVPELTIERTTQAYTRLGARRCRYEGPIGQFEAELALDEDDVVIDYPALFMRLP